MGRRRRCCRVSQLPLLLLGLSSLPVCIWSQESTSVFAIGGENFTFALDFKGKINEIVWKKGKDKVAESDQQKLIQYYDPLKERGVLDISSGDLTIRNVNVKDSAEYDAQVLPDGHDQFQNSKFILEVLDPPPSPVLNCTVNGQYNISCKSDFPKDVTYSWNYASTGKNIEATGSVIQIEKKVDLSEQVVCTIKISKTEVSSSVSLSACFRNSTGSESLARGRSGLIAIIIFLLVLAVIALVLFVLWRKGSLSKLLHWLPTKQSAAYKTTEEHPGESQVFVEEGVRVEATGLEETKTLVPGNSQSINQSPDDKGEAIKLLESKHETESLQSNNQDHENMPNKNKEPGEENSESTIPMTLSDPPATQENTE